METGSNQIGIGVVVVVEDVVFVVVVVAAVVVVVDVVEDTLPALLKIDPLSTNR